MRLRWTRLALSDLNHLYSYIAEHDPQAAGNQMLLIQEAAERLRQFPEMGKTGRVQATRELHLFNSPYVIIYRVKGPEIQVISVLHHKRRWPDELE